jgi:hypothetical protein
MNTAKSFLPILVAALALGCQISGGSAEALPNQNGQLSVTWTVRSSQDARACDDVRATGTEVVVLDRSGNVVADTIASCPDFEATLVLPAGTFDAEVTLVDSSGNAVSTTLPLKTLDITPGTNLTVDVAFPAESIL